MSRLARLISLNTKIDDVISFDEDTYKPRIVQRYIGPGSTVLIHGKKGQRLSGSAEAAWNNTNKVTSGLVIGGGAGAGLGAALGAGVGALSKRPGAIKGLAKLGAEVGAGSGAGTGAVAGQLIGRYGKKADEIYRRRTGQTNLSAILDRILAFDYGDDDDEEKKPGSIVGSAVKAGALTTAVGAGLYGAGSIAKSPVGLGYTGRETVANAGRDLSTIGRGGLGNISSTIGRGATVSANAGKNLYKGAKTYGGGVKSAFAGGGVAAAAKKVGGDLNAGAGKAVGSAITGLYNKLRGFK